MIGVDQMQPRRREDAKEATKRRQKQVFLFVAVFVPSCLRACIE